MDIVDLRHFRDLKVEYDAVCKSGKQLPSLGPLTEIAQLEFRLMCERRGIPPPE